MKLWPYDWCPFGMSWTIITFLTDVKTTLSVLSTNVHRNTWSIRGTFPVQFWIKLRTEECWLAGGLALFGPGLANFHRFFLLLLLYLMNSKLWRPLRMICIWSCSSGSRVVVRPDRTKNDDDEDDDNSDERRCRRSTRHPSCRLHPCKEARSRLVGWLVGR